MKRFVVLLQAAVFLSIPCAGFSQSLADLANKEKERRQQVGQETKVITNEDVYHGEIPEPAVEQPAKKQDSTEKESAKESPSKAASPETDEPVDFQGRPESFWRETMAEARKKVKDLENQSNVLTLKLNDLQMQFYREDDGFKREGIQREIQKTLYEQDKNKEDLAKAKDALQDLEKEARKSGALPGWIESKNN
jgi:hypothetical protein